MMGTGKSFAAFSGSLKMELDDEGQLEYYVKGVRV